VGRHGSVSLLYLSGVEATQLAQELARRMRDVVPLGIIVIVEGDMLKFLSDSDPGTSGSYACQWIYLGTGPEQDRLSEACWHALDDLQDFVDEKTTEPWPGLRTPPKACARIEDDFVLLWFGDPEKPDLVLESVPLGG
jgi:hypothetical protein